MKRFRKKCAWFITISFDPQKKTVFPLPRRNQGSERLCSVQKATQLLRGRARIKTQGSLVLARHERFGCGGDGKRRCWQGSAVIEVRSLG